MCISLEIYSYYVLLTIQFTFLNIEYQENIKIELNKN